MFDLNLISSSLKDFGYLFVSPTFSSIMLLIISVYLVNIERISKFSLAFGFVVTNIFTVFLVRQFAGYLEVNYLYIQYTVLVITSITSLWAIGGMGKSFFTIITKPIYLKMDFTLSTKTAESMTLGGIFGTLWAFYSAPSVTGVLFQSIQNTHGLQNYLILILYGVVNIVYFCLVLKIAEILFMKRDKKFFSKFFGLLALIVIVLLWAYPDHKYTFIGGANGQIVNLNLNTRSISNVPYKAPEFSKEGIWLNSKPLTLDDLKGKVVLVDFLTSTCVDCAGVVPYLNNWFEKYGTGDLVIIGVSIPEFNFEKDVKNIQSFVKKNDIKYPIFIDSEFKTWNEYDNQQWPAFYLINKDGRVVYEGFGSSDLKTVEKNIQILLNTSMNLEDYSKTLPKGNKILEMYFGVDNQESIEYDGTLIKGKITEFQFPDELKSDKYALSGKWLFENDYIESKSVDSQLKVKFTGKRVFGVFESNHLTRVKVYLDGVLISSEMNPEVSTDGKIKIMYPGLYEIVNVSNEGEHELIIEFPAPNIRLYSLSFTN